MTSNRGAERFKTGVETRDVEAALEALADDVVLHSPVSFKPFEGRAVVSHVLRTVSEVFEDFRYTDHLTEPGLSSLVFAARVGDREVQGIDLIRENDEGLIEDITVLVRPLSGLAALAEQMKERLGAAPTT
jgi:SnoaL-like domain